MLLILNYTIIITAKIGEPFFTTKSEKKWKLIGNIL